jgi:ADP-heptose:LPS heptosyltransferase
VAGFVLDEAVFNRIKTDAMRVAGAVRAPAEKSFLVRSAAALRHRQKTLREKTKIRLRTLFAGMAGKRNSRPEKQLRLLVHVKGGIGDVVMSRVFVSRLRRAFPFSEIYFCHDSRETADMIFPRGEQPELINGFRDRKYIPSDYDIIMRGCHFLMFSHYDMERIERLAPDFVPAFRKALEIQECFRAFDEFSPCLDGHFAEIMIRNGYSRISSLGLFSGLEFYGFPVGQNDRCPLPLGKTEQNAVLAKHGLEHKKYITIHSGMNVNTSIAGEMTRNWPEENWRRFAVMFRERHPEIKIAQIGGSTSRPFDFADIQLAGSTKISELPYIIDGAALHIDGETGMAHLARLTGTPAVVMYGPSRAEYLSYAGNENISAGNCGGCMNIDDLWMTRCILGKSKAEQCVSQIKPETVMAAAEKFLKG